MPLQYYLVEILDVKMLPQFLLCPFPQLCDLQLANLVAKSLAGPGDVPEIYYKLWLLLLTSTGQVIYLKYS